MTRPNEKAPAVATAQGLGFADQNGCDSPSLQLSAQALKVIDGEQQARAFLERLYLDQTDAHDLGVILSRLCGPTLRGFCRVLVKELEVRHA